MEIYDGAEPREVGRKDERLEMVQEFLTNSPQENYLYLIE